MLATVLCIIFTAGGHTAATMLVEITQAEYTALVGAYLFLQ
jgi:hypothetical protein